MNETRLKEIATAGRALPQIPCAESTVWGLWIWSSGDLVVSSVVCWLGHWYRLDAGKSKEHRISDTQPCRRALVRWTAEYQGLGGGLLVWRRGGGLLLFLVVNVP